MVFNGEKKPKIIELSFLRRQQFKEQHLQRAYESIVIGPERNRPELLLVTNLVRDITVMEGYEKFFLV